MTAKPDMHLVKEQIEKRAARLRAEADALLSLPDDFLAAITESQIEANKGWRPDGETLVDARINYCPRCNAPGLNTCWGYWAYSCGANFDADGDAL